MHGGTSWFRFRASTVLRDEGFWGSPWKAANLSKVKLVEPELSASKCENQAVGGNRFGQFRVVASA